MTLGSRKPNAYQPLPPALPPVREERPCRRVGRVRSDGLVRAADEPELQATTPLRDLSAAGASLAMDCANGETGPYDTARSGGRRAAQVEFGTRYAWHPAGDPGERCTSFDGAAGTGRPALVDRGSSDG